METKLNHSDLSALFAKEANISLSKSEQFTKAVFDLIIEGLEQDGIVKINGLGTFRIADVASRNSVNVNTGEKFEIKGHRKITFIPADSLKEDVNQPFAMFEPVEVDESYCDDEEAGEDTAQNDAYDVAEIPVEAPAMEENVTEAETEEMSIEYGTSASAPSCINIEEEIPAEKEMQVVDSTAINIEEEMPATNEEKETRITVSIEEKMQNCEPVQEIDHTDNNIPEEHVLSAPDEPVELSCKEDGDMQSSPEPVVEDIEKTETTTENVQLVNKNNNRRTLFISLASVVIILLIGGFYLWRDNGCCLETKKENPVVLNVKQHDSKIIENVGNVEECNAEDNVQPVDEPYRFTVTEKFATLDITSLTVSDTVYYIVCGELSTHKVKPGDRLTKIALEYYGDKRAWPYIVSYNRLKHPDEIVQGMELTIPKLFPAE